MSQDLFNDLHNRLVIKDRISTCESVSRYYWGLEPNPLQKNIWHVAEDLKYPAILTPGPRDHAKTYAGLILITKRILNNPNLRVLIAQKSREQARKSVRILKDFFTLNKKVIADFGELKDNPWEADRFYLERKDKQIKDPTVEGVGVMGTITGGHFDFIFADDILDDVNARTELTRSRVSDWFRGTVMGLAEPSTQTLLAYTRKDYRDIYGELQENPMFYHPECRFSIYGNHNSCGYRAILREPETVIPRMDDNGVITEFEIKGDYEVLWPEHRPLQWLLQQKYRYGEIYFNREYQNDPSGMRGIFFSDKWLQYWVWPHEWTKEHEEGPYIEIPEASELSFYLAVDPAIAASKPDSDYFAVATLALDRLNHVYLYDTFQSRLDFPAQVKYIVSRAEEIRPRAIYIETTAYQDALAQQVSSLGNLPIVPVKTGTDKKSRAIAVSPMLERGQVYVREDMEDFLTQYREFPSGRHDDLLDAFMIGMQEITAKHLGSTDFAAYMHGGEEYSKERIKLKQKKGFYG